MDLPLASEDRLKVDAFQRKHHTAVLTLLFTDLVGSTRLKQNLGDSRAIALLQQHHALVRELLGRFPEAEEINTAGDSFFIVLVRPSDAVRFALLLQARLRRFAAQTAQALFDRIGIHLGEVIVEERLGSPRPKDLYGIQVDTCARVMARAGGDQILLTRAAFDNARPVLKGEDLEGIGSLSWMNHGPYLMKGVEEPVEICEVGEAGKAVLQPPPDSEKIHRHVSPDSEPVLGWRPALGQPVPNTPWTLERKLGEGGFGEVWVAWNERLQERRVFKFCFRADRVRSLRRELALFQVLKKSVGAHSNIVPVRDVYFDQPPYYLVMDYGEGKDLLSWCAGQGGAGKVPLATRLEIVAQIADALQAAHDAGVIHRDVKPSNILVSDAPPGSAASHAPPTAKLTDFGIGQIVSDEVRAGMTRSGFTQTLMGSAALAGSQMYMAPELIGGGSGSTRSDIYSLGVVLYQLLVGDFGRPLTTDWSEDLPDALLREDLKHCFARNPSERFAGAGQLAKHLRSFEERKAERAAEQAFLAAREKAAYRRGVLRTAAVAFVIVTAVAALAVFAVKQSRTAGREARRAVAAELEAKSEASKSRQVVQFLKEMLKGVGPSVARGRDTKMLREILDTTVERVGHDLKNQPDVEAELRLLIGEVYWELGEYAKAEAMHRAVLAIAIKLRGPEHPDVATALNDLAAVFNSQDKLAEAEKLYRDALAMRQKLLGNQHADVASSLNDLAIVLEKQGRLKEAEAMHQEALTMRRNLLGPENREVATSLNNLAIVLHDQGNLTEAEALQRESLAMLQKVLGAEHTAVAAALTSLASLLEQEGKLAEAEVMQREALAMFRKLLGAEHPDVAIALNHVALVLQRRGKLTEAEALQREALTLRRKLLGEENSAVANSLYNLANILGDQGKFTEAEALSREALALRRKLFTNDNPVVAHSLNGLAGLLREQNKLAEAETLSREALAMQEKLFGPENPDVANSLNTLANLLRDQGKLAEAEALNRKALALRRKLFGNENPDVANSLGSLAVVLFDQSKLAQAEASFREELALLKKLLGEEHGDVTFALNNLAALLALEGKLPEAETLHREVLARFRKLLGHEHPNVAVALNNLADLLRQRGKWVESESLHREAQAMLRKRWGDEHPLVADSLSNLANLLREQGRLAEAETLQREALAMRKKLSGAEHLDVAISLNHLARVLRDQNRLAESEAMNREALGLFKKLLGAEHYRVAAALNNLGQVLRDQARLAEAETMHREALAIRKKAFGNEHPDVAGSLEALAAVLRDQGKLAEAETLSRECLAIGEQMLPDDWRTSIARSALGGVLLALKKYAEAEPLLLAGFAGLKERQAAIPADGRPRVREAIQRLAQLYAALGKLDQAAEWNQKLNQFGQAEAAKTNAQPRP